VRIALSEAQRCIVRATSRDASPRGVAVGDENRRRLFDPREASR